jgi:hypothetical protein
MLSVAGLYSVEWENDSCMMNMKGFGEKWSWLNPVIVSEFTWGDRRKPLKCCHDR